MESNVINVINVIGGKDKSLSSKPSGKDKKKPTFEEINTIIESSYYNNTNDNISTKHIEPLERLLFKKKFAPYVHMHESYNRWVSKDIVEYLVNGNYIIDEEIHDNNLIRHKIKFSNIEFNLPKDESTTADKILTPQIAKIRNFTYAGKITATVEQIMEEQNIQTGEIQSKVLYSDNIPICKIPIMVRSAFCVSQPGLAPNIKNTECPYDPGCNFISKGNEKVVISLEKLADDRIYIFSKDDENYISQITSKSKLVNGNLHIFRMYIDKDNAIMVILNKYIEVNICIILRALGIETDKDIYNHIVYDTKDIEMINVVKSSLIRNEQDIVQINEENKIIYTKKDALDYLMTKIINKKLSETNINDRVAQQQFLINEYFKNDFLPHIGTDQYSLITKGRFIGYMAHKLLLCYLKRNDPDNRDSYVNKRISLPGEILHNQFKPSMRKTLNETSKKFRKRRHNNIDKNYPNIISQISQSNTIELSLNQAMATGTFGVIGQKTKGVAQQEQRYTYLQYISYLRRVMTPTNDQSTNKVVNMRHVDQHCYGYIDSIETPEGNKIGMVKNLALSATVTMDLREQVPIIKEIIEKLIKTNKYDIYDFNIPITDYKKYIKIFINGEWIGFTKNAFKLINILKKKRSHGEIHRHVGIAYYTSTKKDICEIRINTDAGRLIRPLLTVSDNKLNLTKEMLDRINNLSYDIQGKINSLEQFLQEYPGIIEYVDVEESTNTLVAMYAQDVHENYKQYNTEIDNPNEKGDKINRYTNIYKMYTHCEFHPMMMLGTITSNIPLMEHNQAPRNYYNFAQVRQAMGIPTTNFKKGAFITFHLLNTMKPLVISRSADYTHTDKLPAGEMAVVAIQSYGGYNQEDSIIINLSAVERGFMRAHTYKKYEDISKKNIYSKQEDEFGIKDKSLVIMNEKEKNYSKVNDKGFAPEETKLNNGDIIITKVIQLDDKKDAKIYKDESQIYKSNVSGHVDKVWHNKLTDADGYAMIKMRVRSERIPVIGDKFCSRHGQKGTIGARLRAQDMPFTEKDGIQPDIIINPCCIPSRMTIAQLFETVIGKAASLIGKFIDGTPFTNININDISRILELYGYNGHGEEAMYCGQTGIKFRTTIFIGPTYYLRLKHMVLDKSHGRSTGPRQIVNRQPMEGRAANGGLRFGEMERDCQIAYGNALTLKERLVNLSDPYFAPLCNNCGEIATKMKQVEAYYCPICNKSDITLTEMPYSIKLLMQNLKTVGMNMKLFPKSSIYTKQE